MKENSSTSDLFHIFERQAIRSHDLQLMECSLLCLLRPKNDGTYSILAELAVALNGKKQQIPKSPYRFLQAVHHRQPYQISRSLTYHPQQHTFSSRDTQLLRILWQELTDMPSEEASRLDLLPISASLWKQLEPVLVEHSAVQLQYYLESLPLDQQLQSFERVTISDEKLPVKLTLIELDDRLCVNGEELQWLLLLPAHGLACYEGIFYRLSWNQAEQLAGFAKLLRNSTWQLLLEQGDRAVFLEQALPQLHALMQIQLTNELSKKLTTMPLQGNIYLDRVRERLLIGVEFQYGSLSIDPFRPEQAAITEEQILLRDRDGEATIIQLLTEIKGILTEGGIIVEGDDDEYLFFHSILPRLKLLTRIHATTAVKLRYVNEQAFPQLHLTWEEKSNWLQYRFSMTGISNDELKQLLKALTEKRKYYTLSEGALLSLESPQFNSLLRVMSELGLLYPSKFDDQLPITRVIPTMLTLQKHEQSVVLSRSLKRFIESLGQTAQHEVELPPSITADPRDYQLDGFQWMHKLTRHHLGGILADEMGLGKTLQAIILLAKLQEETDQTSISNSNLPGNTTNSQSIANKQLVIAPSPLLYNWKQELERFAPSLKVHVLDSAQLHGERLQITNEAQIWIASYTFIRMHQSFLQQQAFLTIVCDEAQMFKNDYTKTSLAIRELNAVHRFALTGTPIENRLGELWSILSFVNPELFSDKGKWLELPKESLKKITQPFMLRRTKQEVMQELPPKYESTLYAPLTMEQKKLYLAYLAKLQEDTLKHLDSKRKGQRRIKLLAGITRLRQICCHPELFIDNYQGDSAKLQQLLQLVSEKIAAGNRLLIFSQFTSMLHIIARELQWQGYSHFYLDGSTPPKERIELVDAFNQGARSIFLMSLKAGGTGLNVTGADTVILYDLWWNPAVEQQAADRVHRIGQQLPVHVIRLVAEGTLEDKMIQVQQRKQQLINDMLDQEQLDSDATWSEAELLSLLQSQQNELE